MRDFCRPREIYGDIELSELCRPVVKDSKSKVWNDSIFLFSTDTGSVQGNVTGAPHGPRSPLFSRGA